MLSPKQKRFLIVEQSFVPAVFNFLINSWFVWYLFKEQVHIPLIGEPSVLVDACVTLFLLPAITCLIVTPLVTSIARKKPEIRTTSKRSDYPILSLLPANLWGRSGVIGLVAMVLFTPLVVLGIVLFGADPITVDAYIIYKGSYAAVVSAIIGPAIAWSAICDQSARTS